jgi:hypothetical protein
VAESKRRVLVASGRDAMFQDGDRIVLARRSEARYVVAVLFLAVPTLAALVMWDIPHFVLGLVGAALLAWVIVTGTAPFGYRYPMFMIDARARALLTAKGQLIAPAADVRIAMNDGMLTLTRLTHELATLRGTDVELIEAVAVLRAAGVDAQ